MKKNKDLELGTKIEMEHTKSKKKAAKIAKDHIDEHPLYYDKKKGLPAMEKKLSKMKKVSKGTKASKGSK
jgi:hypothetical protein